MKPFQILCPWALSLSSALLAGSATQKPQWVLDVRAPRTAAEKQLTSVVKVKIEFEFGENTEDAVNAYWSKESIASSWSSDLMVWRHPLKTLSIWINGELQSLPYEALANEGDINECDVSSSPHEVKIALYGGDAGEAYELELLFHESKRMKGRWTLVRRIWRLGEFSDTEWDETDYHSSNWDDPDM